MRTVRQVQGQPRGQERQGGEGGEKVQFLGLKGQDFGQTPGEKGALCCEVT